MDDMDMELEYHNANLQLEREICETLDRLKEVGGDEEDLKFLAWQCGARWIPERKLETH